MFRLCELFGVPTVGELEARLGWDDVYAWLAYFQVKEEKLLQARAKAKAEADLAAMRR